MKKTIDLWQIWGFAITALCGTLLHFLYDWFDKSLVVAPFSSVNESTWEHMKLLFWSMFIYAILQSFFFKNRDDFWCVKLRGILLGLVTIPVIYYTYNGAIRKSPDWLNISIFFVSVALVYLYENKLFKKETLYCKSQTIAFLILCIIGLFFIIFTFTPPEIGLFQDPTNYSFGI